MLNINKKMVYVLTNEKERAASKKPSGLEIYRKTVTFQVKFPFIASVEEPHEAMTTPDPKLTVTI